jgi:hypothetical protein
MSKPLRIALVSGLLILALAVMWTLGTRSQTRTVLRNYKADLKQKGEKLTFAELTRFRATNENDSQSVITNAVASIGVQRFHPSTLQMMNYVGPGLARAAWKEEALPWSASPGRATKDTWADFAAQMPALEQPLREIRQALQNPAPDAGPPTNVFDRRVNFVALRSAAQWLMGATLSDLQQGQLEPALENLEALAALARMEREEYSLVAQMIRVAICGLGTTTTWEALQAPGWTEPQLARLQKAWERVDLIAAVETGFLAERAFGQEFWGLAADPKAFSKWQRIIDNRAKPNLGSLLSEYVVLPAYKLTSMDKDQLFHLQIMQESLNALRALEQHHAWKEARQGLTNSFARVNTIAASPQRFRYWFSLLVTPNFPKASDTAVRNETERQLTVAAIALKRFQLRHGSFPPDLAALVPEFLAAMPWDPMSGKALGYHPKTNGDFVLYSVGADGQDDGGDPRPASGARSGLWEGRDAVWPSSVESHTRDTLGDSQP